MCIKGENCIYLDDFRNKQCFVFWLKEIIALSRTINLLFCPVGLPFTCFGWMPLGRSVKPVEKWDILCFFLF